MYTNEQQPSQDDQTGLKLNLSNSRFHYKNLKVFHQQLQKREREYLSLSSYCYLKHRIYYNPET